MLGGLDVGSAYLTVEEVAAWKAGKAKPLAGPGFSILKSRRTLQVVAVHPGSAAEQAGVAVGDHLRVIEGESLSDLSLRQVRNLLEGEAGSTVSVGMLRPRDGFSRNEFRLVRELRKDDAYVLKVERGLAILTIEDAGRVSIGDLSAELDDVRSRGIDRLLIDLRNRSEVEPRDIAALAGLFSTGDLLRLRDRAGEVVETLSSPREKSGWSGEISILVNFATAGGAEALARVIQTDRQARVFGEPTFGLGSEAKLVELDNGAGVLISHALWETASGEGWNEEGITPDQQVEGTGEDFKTIETTQIEKVIEILTSDAGETADESEETADAA